MYNKLQFVAGVEDREPANSTLKFAVHSIKDCPKALS
jgi:porphobilinogen deaminase